MCPNSLAKDDPKCLNGGRLHANNSTMEGPEYYANCAYCDCPHGWGGADCSGAVCRITVALVFLTTTRRPGCCVNMGRLMGGTRSVEHSGMVDARASPCSLACACQRQWYVVQIVMRSMMPERGSSHCKAESLH